jgi:hypothetical protein
MAKLKVWHYEEYGIISRGFGVCLRLICSRQTIVLSFVCGRHQMLLYAMIDMMVDEG